MEVPGYDPRTQPCKGRVLPISTIPPRSFKLSTTTQRTCEKCSKVFTATNKEIRRGNAKFCSLSCSNSRPKGNVQGRVTVTCAYCQVEIIRKKSSLTKSKSGLFFCCREHKDISQRIGGIKEIQPSHYSDQLTSYRTKAFRLLPNKCNRCGWNKLIKILQVHHIDKDRSNNDLENLELLCPNCHAEEHWA